MAAQLGEQLINGLVLGSIYALVASGLSLIWGSMHMLNWAHGEFYMLGGFALFFSLNLLHLPVWLAVILAALVAGVLGLATQRLLVERLLEKPGWDVSHIVVTLGLSIFLQNLALRLWGADIKNIPYFVQANFKIFGLNVAGQRLLILAISVLVILAFVMVLKRTKLGMALRAVAQDRDAAALMGIDVRSTYGWTMACSTGLAGLAAAMLSPIFAVNPWMGVSLLTKAFVVCVIGGLGSLEGAIVGAVVLGILESISVVLLSSQWMNVASFVVLIVALWVRPTGFFGAKEG
jgi:branched-chain amino acid transport system permease protein